MEAHRRFSLRAIAERSPYGASYFVWRCVAGFALAVALGALIIAPFLFNKLNATMDKSDEVIAANHGLICALGDLVTISQGPRRLAIQGPRPHVIAELEFLTSVRDAKCRLINEQPAIAAEIDATITFIQRYLRRGKIP